MKLFETITKEEPTGLNDEGSHLYCIEVHVSSKKDMKLLFEEMAQHIKLKYGNNFDLFCSEFTDGESLNEEFFYHGGLLDRKDSKL